jgi:hypothetical protein
LLSRFPAKQDLEIGYQRAAQDGWPWSLLHSTPVHRC